MQSGIPDSYRNAAYPVVGWLPSASAQVHRLLRETPKSVAAHLLAARHYRSQYMPTLVDVHEALAREYLNQSPHWEREQAEVLFTLGKLDEVQKAEAIAQYVLGEPGDPTMMDLLNWAGLTISSPGKALAIAAHALTHHEDWSSKAAFAHVWQL